MRQLLKPSGNDDRHGTKEPNHCTIEQTCFTEMACPTAHVSAFCRIVTRKVIPRHFWGGDSNERIIMQWIDQLVELRRFESLTLHQVTQRLQVRLSIAQWLHSGSDFGQITSVSWLRLCNDEDASRLSKSDFEKRKEVFLEFIYWLVDSFIIPLISSNFHVTESNVHRHRLFYFRHDVWRMLSEPAVTTLKLKMFEETSLENTTRLLSARQLGFSKIRLLPKRLGFRTITNLKKRQQILKSGVLSLGRSINTIMTPVFNAITYEKVGVLKDTVHLFWR